MLKPERFEKNSIFGRIDRTPFSLMAGQIRTIPRPTRTTIFIYRRYLQKELMDEPYVVMMDSSQTASLYIASIQ